MSRTRDQKITCEHCKCVFRPDARNLSKQKYCSSPECRKASKAASNRIWREKPENIDYFRGPEHVKRVQEWRRNNPGYWRRKPASRKSALQDHCPVKELKNHGVKAVEVIEAKSALQDHWMVQPAVIVGFISKFCGIALQDDMEKIVRSLQTLGEDILNNSTSLKGGLNAAKAPSLSAART